MSREEEEFENNGGNMKSVIILLGIIFLPGLIIGVIVYYVTLRVLKQRGKVIAAVVGLMTLLAAIIFFTTNAWGRLMGVLSDIGSIQDNWIDLVPFGLAVNLVIGGIIGFTLSMERVRMMKNNPENRLADDHSWMYNFEFSRTPWEVVRRKKKVEQLKNGDLIEDAASPLGLSEEYEYTDSRTPEPIYVRDSIVKRYMSEANLGTVITGGMGSGKTITMMNMIFSDIVCGRSVFMLDFKSDPQIAAQLASWANDYDYTFHHFVGGKKQYYNIPFSKGQSSYDPLVSAGSSKADMVLGMREYDTAAAVHKGNMRQILSIFFNALDNANPKKAPNVDWDNGELRKLASALDPQSMIQLSAALSHDPDLQNEFDSTCEDLRHSPLMKNAYSELKGHLRTMLGSSYGEWLRTRSDAENINLLELMNTPKNIVLFSLDADGSSDFSQFFGSFIISDLTQVSSKRRAIGASNQVCAYVDEFQALPPTSLRPLLEKARASKIAMTIASQSFEQVVAASGNNGESNLNSILDSCSNFFIHAGATQTSAERVSKVIGQDRVTQYRKSNSSKSSMFSLNFKNKQNSVISKDVVDDWKVPPRKMMGLSSPNESNGFKGTAVIVKKTSADPRHKGISGAIAEVTWMIPNAKVLEKHELLRIEKLGPVFDNVEPSSEGSTPYDEDMEFDHQDYEYNDDSSYTPPADYDEDFVFDRVGDEESVIEGFVEVGEVKPRGTMDSDVTTEEDNEDGLSSSINLFNQSSPSMFSSSRPSVSKKKEQLPKSEEEKPAPQVEDDDDDLPDIY